MAILPRKDHLIKLAHHFGLKNGASIIEEVQDAISNWAVIARETEISNQNMSKIEARFKEIRN